MMMTIVKQYPDLPSIHFAWTRQQILDDDSALSHAAFYCSRQTFLRPFGCKPVLLQRQLERGHCSNLWRNVELCLDGLKMRTPRRLRR